MLSLELKDVVFRYGVARAILDRLNFSVAAGERVAVLGESGMGKSSLLRVVAGLERISEGQIHLNGKVVSSDSVHSAPERRNVGMVFQDWAVFPHLNVFQNVAFGLDCRGRSQSGRVRVEQLLEEFELVGLDSRSPSTLSGGQLQRVACARALAPRPHVLLLDEAFSSLDVALRQRIRAQVIHALTLEKITSVLVTHDPQEASEFAHRIFYLRNGVLLESGSLNAD